MNAAFKHLEAKLRFADLSIGQWASVLGGVLFAFVFAEYLSPIGGMGGVIIGVYLGAIPASAAFFASLSEFDLWGLVGAAVRWHRRDGRHVPGAGESALGYALLADEPRRVAVGGVRSGSGGVVGVKETAARPGELLAIEAIDQHRPGGHQRGRVRAHPARDAAEPADPLAGTIARRSPRVLPPRRRGCARASRCSSTSRRGRCDLDEILAGARREVAAWAGPAPTSGRPARDALALSRWRLQAAMEESLRLHADDQAAVDFNAYVVVPHVPRQRDARAALAELRRGGAGARAARARRRRAPARGAREPRARRHAARGARRALAAHDRSSTARRWSRCCGRG